MKFYHFPLLFVLLSIFNPFQGFGQDSGADRGEKQKFLTLEEALKIAGEGNFELRIAGFERDQAEADFHKSSAVFLPRVELSETFITTDDPLSVFGMKLKQERVGQQDFAPDLLNDPPEIRNFTTKVEIRQPLVNLDGFFGRHAAAKAADAAGAKFIRTRHGIELAVKNAYFGSVLASGSRDAVATALEAAKAYREQAKNFLDRGMIRQSDYLMADVRALELEIQKTEAEDAARDAAGRLRVILGLPDSVEIVPTDSLSLLAVGETAFDADRVFTTRSDMVAIRNGIDAASAGLRMHQAGWLPTLNAFGSFELNNDRLAGAKARSWMVGAMVRWTIFAGFDRAGEIQKAAAKRSALETEYQKMRAEGGRELASAVRGLESARLRVDLAARAVDQAAESFRVTSDRYEAGLERTSDLLQADASLLNARLTYLRALYNHSASVFMIEFLLERKVTR